MDTTHKSPIDSGVQSGLLAR